MSVGMNIRCIRKEKGMTQKQLGEACGIAEPTIRRYELGKLNPKFSTLQIIAKGLGVSTDDLIDFSDPEEKYLYSNQGKKSVLDRVAHQQKLFREYAPFFVSPIKYMQQFDEEMLDIEEEELEWDEMCIKFLNEMGDIVSNYYSLNAEGKKEAKKRIEELTFVPKYQKKDGE